MDGDCDLLPPIPERSVVLGTLDAEDRLDKRSLLEFEPPWKKSFIRETIWSDLNLELLADEPIPEEGVVGGAVSWLDELEGTLDWPAVVPDGGEGESVSMGTKASSWASLRALPLLGVNPSHITDKISAAFSYNQMQSFPT